MSVSRVRICGYATIFLAPDRAFCREPMSGLLKFNAESFTVFLGNLGRHRSRKRKMILILDNASYHRSVSLESFLEVRWQCLKLEFLPPYSPDLNPIERVWKLTRKLCTHNQYFPCMEDLVHAVTHQLTIWSKPNSVLAKLCCIT